MLGKPRPNRASSVKVDGPKLNRASTTKPKQLTATNKIAEARKQEKDMEYKAELQKYLKERLKQGKAAVKLQESIKQLEDKLKSL